MGKQNNTNDDILTRGIIFIIIIMGIIFLIFAFATLIAPVVVLVLFLVNWIRYLVQDRKWRTTNFWLSDQEQGQYEQAAYLLAHAEGERRKVQDSVTIHGISRNQDGQISQRSYAGKGLRERENTANSLINKYIPIYKELQRRPYMRWKKARSHYSKAFGFGFIIFIIVAMFGILELRNVLDSKLLGSILQSEVVDSTKVVEQPKVVEQGNRTELIEDKNDDTGEIIALKIYGTSIGIMAGFLASLVIIWFIGWLIGRIRFGLKNPEPPLVSMDNVDTYIEEYTEKRRRKEAERRQRKEELRQKHEQKRIAKEHAKAEKNRMAEKMFEETEVQKNIEEMTLDVPISESESAVPVTIKNNRCQQSKEEGLFIAWADSLRNEGYNIIGNWENWENVGPWKNLAVISSINGVDIRIVIEYYEKSKKIYFGIAKLSDEEKVSQELLNSETFQNIMTENGLNVKNNEWWYCLKFSSLDNVFQEYRHLIEAIK